MTRREHYNDRKTNEKRAARLILEACH